MWSVEGVGGSASTSAEGTSDTERGTREGRVWSERVWVDLRCQGYALVGFIAFFIPDLPPLLSGKASALQLVLGADLTSASGGSPNHETCAKVRGHAALSWVNPP